MNFQFFILGYKGYECLSAFINEFGANKIEFVCFAKDHGVSDDFSLQICALCKEQNIEYIERRDYQGIGSLTSIKFAIGWRWLIPSNRNLIVFHDSLLPSYRGFSPLVNALLNGDKKIGVTALFASEKYDEGDIIESKSIDISYPIKISKVIELITPCYITLVKKIAKLILCDGEIHCAPQNHVEATYSLWRDEEDYFIDWSQQSNYIKRFVDSVGEPYSGARTTLNDKSQIIGISEVEVVQDVTVIDRDKHIGKVIFFENKCPVVVCGSGLIRILKTFQVENNNIKSINFRSRFGV